jgi:hypothetical protein
MTNSFNMSNWRRKYVLVSETDKVLDENVYQDNKMLILKSILKDDRIQSQEEAMGVFDMMEKFNMTQDEAISQYLESKYDYEREKGGDREDDETSDKYATDLMEEENPVDIISMDVPLFIRMLEFAREDASTDMDLHDLAQKAISMSSEGEPITMMHYDDLVAKAAPVSDAMSLYEKYIKA